MPDLRQREERQHGEVNFHLTQFLSDHGSFRSFLFQRRRSDDASTVKTVNPEKTQQVHFSKRNDQIPSNQVSVVKQAKFLNVKTKVELAGIVECMAAGLVMLAHRSGGPKLDIVEEEESSRTGFLAETAEEYADVIVRIINTPSNELDNIRKAARKSVERFSIDSFEEKFLSVINPLLETKKTN
ncbi:asparagine-linked glycosylation protein [Homalodisca vitripennis]|nr:asparagine-linked glycosylation protein [Homalodisca vitripennis]